MCVTFHKEYVFVLNYSLFLYSIYNIYGFIYLQAVNPTDRIKINCDFFDVGIKIITCTGDKLTISHAPSPNV